MKVRTLKGMSIAGILMLIDRLSSFLPLKRMFDKGFIDRATFSENIIIGDYTSTLHLFVIAMIIFVFTEEYINEQSIISQLVRYGDVKRWYRNRIGKTTVLAFLMSVIYAGIEVVCCCMYADRKLIVKHGIVESSLLQIIVLTLYLMLVWHLKEYMRIFHTVLVSQLITVFSLTAFYFIISYVLFPMDDKLGFIEIIGKYCRAEYQILDCVGIIVWLSGIIFIAYQSMLSTRRRRDLWL